MNILFLDQFSDPGGAQLCLKDLLPEVQRRGWNPYVMAPGDGELLQWCRQQKIPVHPLPLHTYSNGRKSAADLLRFTVDVPRMVAAVRSLVSTSQCDLVYVNGPRALPAVLGISCPVVFHAHNYIRPRYARQAIAWTLRGKRAKVIAASQYVARSYAGRAQVIYNGVPDLQRAVRRFERRPMRVGIIGRIAPEKGHLDFVRAAIQIAASGGGAEFFVYGKRLFAEAPYEAAVRELARNAPVKFCGWTGDVAQALLDLEILAVPSGPDEAATRVILEAFSAGTPVVAYRSGGIPEILDDACTGVFTEAAAPEPLARRIRTLIGNPRLMEQLSIAGRREWQRRFRVEQFCGSVCDLLEAEVRLRARGVPPKSIERG